MHSYKQINLLRLLLLCVACSPLLFPHHSYAEEKPENLPAGFRYIGLYQLNSKLRVENGVAQAVVISPLNYRVYSDGMAIRVYIETAGEDSYTAYDIYRSDGIGVAKTSGEIELVAGVQAYSTKGKMLRQISVTRNSLTMVKTAPRSHRVIVTRAKAAEVTASEISSDK